MLGVFSCHAAFCTRHLNILGVLKVHAFHLWIYNVRKYFGEILYPSKEQLHRVASSRYGLGHRNFDFSPVSYSDTESALGVHLTVSYPNPLSVSAVTLNSSMTSYRLTGLKEKTVYRVQISGFTKAGDGPPTLSHPFSTPKYGSMEALCMLPSINPCFMHYIWHYSLPFPAFQGVTKCSCTRFIIQSLVTDSKHTKLFFCKR